MISTIQHVSDTLEIITTPDIPESNPCKDYASIHLKNYMTQTLSKKKSAGAQTILASDLKGSAEMLIKAILSNNIAVNRRTHITLALELILFSAQKPSYSKEMDLSLELFQFLKQNYFGQINQENIEQIMSLINAIF